MGDCAVADNKGYAVEEEASLKGKYTKWKLVWKALHQSLVCDLSHQAARKLLHDWLLRGLVKDARADPRIKAPRKGYHCWLKCHRWRVLGLVFERTNFNCNLSVVLNADIYLRSNCGFLERRGRICNFKHLIGIKTQIFQEYILIPMGRISLSPHPPTQGGHCLSVTIHIDKLE